MKRTVYIFKGIHSGGLSQRIAHGLIQLGDWESNILNPEGNGRDSSGERKFISRAAECSGQKVKYFLLSFV